MSKVDNRNSSEGLGDVLLAIPAAILQFVVAVSLSAAVVGGIFWLCFALLGGGRTAFWGGAIFGAFFGLIGFLGGEDALIGGAIVGCLIGEIYFAIVGAVSCGILGCIVGIVFGLFLGPRLGALAAGIGARFHPE